MVKAHDGKATAGQTLVETIEAYLNSFMVFPSEHYALVAALWIINTWVYQVFDAVPYLAITAQTKRAGKTLLLDLIGFLSKNAEKGSAGTPAAMYGLMEEYGGWATLLFDEAEKMSGGQLGVMRQFMNLGYRRGETVPRRIGKHTIKFPCFGPKAFALIGDPEDTLRDRCILMILKRAVPSRPYRPTTAAAEAQPIIRDIQAYLKSGALADLTVVAPDWIENRDQELWEPLYSLCLGMGLNKATIERFQRASGWMIEQKGAPIQRYVDMGDAELIAQNDSYAEKAIRDLRSVLNKADDKHTGDIFSAVAVERMKQIPTSGWANFRGVGLNQDMLATLVKTLGVHSRNVAMERGRNRPILKGYKAADVIASAPQPKAKE